MCDISTDELKVRQNNLHEHENCGRDVDIPRKKIN